jgi:Cu2+-exporting ATPase
VRDESGRSYGASLVTPHDGDGAAHAMRGHATHREHAAAPAAPGYPDHPELHEAHASHGNHGHDQHAGHSVAGFRDKFWVSLLLTLPALA